MLASPVFPTVRTCSVLGWSVAGRGTETQPATLSNNTSDHEGNLNFSTHLLHLQLMAAKKKPVNPTGMNMKGNVVWNNPKPTAAVGNPKRQSAADKKATAAANGKTSWSKVPVKKADKGFAGSGGTTASGFALSQPTKASNIIKAAGVVLPAGAAKTALNSYALGKTVVHGSPEKGLKSISPRTGSNAKPEDKVNFSWNPKGFKDKRNIENNVTQYTNKDGKSGSVYVGKVKRNSIVKDDNPAITISSKPIKVKKEIPSSSPKLGEKIESELNKRGVGVGSKAKRIAAESKPAKAVKKTVKQAKKKNEQIIS